MISGHGGSIVQQHEDCIAERHGKHLPKHRGLPLRHHQWQNGLCYSIEFRSEVIKVRLPPNLHIGKSIESSRLFWQKRKRWIPFETCRIIKL